MKKEAQEISNPRLLTGARRLAEVCQWINKLDEGHEDRIIQFGKMSLYSFIEGQTQCPVCMDSITSPRILPCQHTFCISCLQTLVDDRNTVSCPLCRNTYNVPNGDVNEFPVNLLMGAMIDRAANRTPTNPPQEHVPQNAPGNQRRTLHDRTPQSVLQENTHNGNNRNPIPDNETSLIPPVRTYEDRSCFNCELPCFRSTWRRIWKVFQLLLRNKRFKRLSLIVGALYILLTTGRLTAGFVKLSTDCYQEKRIAVYLAVKACFGVIFWGAFFILYLSKDLKRAVSNPCIRFYLGIETPFSLVWLILGTIWIFGYRTEVKQECSKMIMAWSSSFLDFSSFLAVVDLSAIFLFILYVLYFACTPENRETLALLPSEEVADFEEDSDD